MKLVFAALLLLTSCARSIDETNLLVRTYGWQCVNSHTGWGLSLNGDFLVTNDCRVSKCFLFEKVTGKYFWQDRTLSKRLVPDENCMGDT
jgi:hypothetical protein